MESSGRKSLAMFATTLAALLVGETGRKTAIFLNLAEVRDFAVSGHKVFNRARLVAE